MARQALIVLATVLGFGILVPLYKGPAFLDPRIIAAYGCIALLFVAPATAESFAGTELMDSPRAALTRLAFLVGFGWGVTVLVLVTALATLNVANWHAELIKPQSELFASVLVCSLAAALAVGALSAMLARMLTASLVKGILRIAFLAVLLAFAFSQRLPDAWQIALAEHSTRRAITRLGWEISAICALMAALLLIPLLRKSSNAPNS
jgi:hypothetical protein